VHAPVRRALVRTALAEEASMPRAIWSGSISFGLVNVPVKVYSAVKQQDLHFNQFEEKSNARIRYKKVSEKTGKEVDPDKIVKGYELSKGHYVMVDPEELEAFEPRATRTIDIEDFVALAEIDPVYFEHTYYLAPDGGEGPERSYALLLAAMEDQEKVGIGRVVMRTKQYLAALRPFDGVMAMSTMLFHDEVVSVSDIEELPVRKKASAREVKMAGQIIESLTTEWDPKRYQDTYRERVLEYIEKKAAGEEVVVEEAEPEEPKVVDLMAALEASLAEAKKGSGKRRPARSRSSSTAGKRGSGTRKSA
jgi:DNA end-binding protein Ku